MERILLGHGSGGRLMHDLIRRYFQPAFDMHELRDSAVLDPGIFQGLLTPDARLAFTTDSYVVSPLFFPGGNIGDLAVFGTVNDLAVVGASPLVLSLGFIIEEGFPLSSFEAVLASISQAADRAGVRIVTGDTKVVERGKGDGLFINTSGIGVVGPDVRLGPELIVPGDKIIVSGLIGNHGIAVLSERSGISFEPPVLSDSAPLHDLCRTMLSVAGGVKMMRDPTRGGVATTLREIAEETGHCAVIEEQALPITPGVQGACDLLGLDPLYVANEGCLIAVVSPGAAGPILERMTAHPLGRRASVIGEVSAADRLTTGMVLLKTAIGGTRVMDMLPGEQLPRIC